MFNEMMAMGSGGGSGGNAVYMDDTQFTVPTTTSTEFTIDTGLSSISRFVFFGKFTDDTNSRQVVVYDARYSNKYATNYLTLHGAGGGSSYSWGSLGNANAYGIKDIQGGRVTLITPSQDTYYVKLENAFCFAEE